MSLGLKRFKQFTKSFLIYGLASALARFFGFLLVPVYTRIFSPSDYGTIDIFNVFIYFVTIFCALEIWGGVSRDYLETESVLIDKQLLISTGFWHIIFLSGFWCALTYIFSGNILNALSIADSYRELYIYTLLIIPFATLFSYFNVLMRFEKKPWLFFAGIFIQLAASTLVSLYTILILKKGVIGFFYGQFAGNFLGTIFFIFVQREYLRFRISFLILKKLLHFSLPIVPAVIAVWLNSYSNRFVMLKYLSLHDIGVYAVALKVASIFLFLEYAFRLAWTPLLYEIIKSDDYQHQLNRIYKLLLKIILLLFCSVAIFSKEIIDILAPSEYSDAASIAALLCIPVLVLILNLIVGSSPSVARKTIYDTIAQIAGFTVNISTMFFTIPQWGLFGAALSYLAGSLITFSFYFYYSRKLISFHLPVIKSVLFFIIIISFALIFGNIEMQIILKIILFLTSATGFLFFELFKDKDFLTIASYLRIKAGM